MTRSRKRREALQLLLSARQELGYVRSSLEKAYSVFNSTSDPELLEASILEISALSSRYSSMLRELKKISEAQP